MNTNDVAQQSLWQAWMLQARKNPRVTTGLLLAGACLLVLLLAGTYRALTSVDDTAFEYALIGGFAGFGATALGALAALGLRSIPVRTQDTMLGFAAGMPGLAAAEQITGSALLGSAVVVLGLAFGVLLMLGLDYFTPHMHQELGTQGPEYKRLNGVWLFVLAIVLHNLPEGMAIGVSFSKSDMTVGLPLTTAIAIQDIPEGLAVALALRAIGIPVGRAVLLAAASGLMEPLGAIVGVGMSSGMAVAYPMSLGLAAGAMIFVVSHEVIPETHRNGHQTFATIGLMAGFAVMMFLDTALG
jgi:ZIP family zinc transporter